MSPSLCRTLDSRLNPWHLYRLFCVFVGFTASIALAGIDTTVLGQVSSPQFRIETEVFTGTPEKRLAKSLTLFDGGRVYDFLMSGESGNGVASVEEVVVFDWGQGRIHLLDQTTQRHLELSQSEVSSMVAGMKANETLRGRDAFLLEPKFTESLDPETQRLEFSSPRLRYFVMGEKVDDSNVLASYFLFADWAARLNATDSRKLPPFARLELNQVLRRRGWIPTDVEFELESLDGATLKARTKHHRLNQLSDNDRMRISSVERQLQEFPAVNLIKYRDLSPERR
jgi:hypothetical protein